MIRVTAPTVPVIDLDEAKAHLRVLHDDDDLLIQGLIDAAVSWMDGWDGVLGRCIMPQTWRMEKCDLSSGIAIRDVSERIDNEDGSATVTCAMAQEKLPSVKVAAKLLVGHWYENREAVGKGYDEQPLAVRSLLAPLRFV